MSHLLALLLLMQGARPERLSETALDATYVLLLVRNAEPRAVKYRLLIEERTSSGRSWELAAFPASLNYEVVRVDRSSTVLQRSNDYGFKEAYLKFFFDLASKKVVKTAEFNDPALSQISDADAQRVLEVPAEFGYFDTPAKKFTFLRVPEVLDWSISNLLVEGDTVWAGLDRHPEGRPVDTGIALSRTSTANWS